MLRSPVPTFLNCDEAAPHSAAARAAASPSRQYGATLTESLKRMQQEVESLKALGVVLPRPQ